MAHGSGKDDRSSADRKKDPKDPAIAFSVPGAKTKNPKDSTQKVVSSMSKKCGRLIKKLRCIQAIDASAWLCLEPGSVISEMVEKTEGGSTELSEEFANGPTFNTEDLINSMQLFSDILMRPGLLPIQSLRLANASPYRGGVLQAVECIMDWAQEIYLDCESLKNAMETSTVGTKPKTPLPRSRAENSSPSSSADIDTNAPSTSSTTTTHARREEEQRHQTPVVPAAAAPADLLPSFSQMSIPAAATPALAAKPPKTKNDKKGDKSADAKSKEDKAPSAAPAAVSSSSASIHERQASMAIEEAKKIIIQKVRPSKKDTERFEEELMRGLEEVAAGKRRRRAGDDEPLSEAEGSDNEGERENKKKKKKKSKSAAPLEEPINRESDNEDERDNIKKKKKSKSSSAGNNKAAAGVAENAAAAIASNSPRRTLLPPPPAVEPTTEREVVQMTPSGDVSFASVRRSSASAGDAVPPAAARSHFGSSQLASTLLAASEAALLNPPHPAPVESAEADLDDSDCQIVESAAAAAAQPTAAQPANDSDNNESGSDASSDDDEDDDRALFQADCFGDISF